MFQQYLIAGGDPSLDLLAFPMRFTDRLTLQMRLRGLPMTGPRGMVMATCVMSVIPYINILIAFPIMWTITVGLLQSSVNRVAALPPNSWDPTTYPGQ